MLDLDHANPGPGIPPGWQIRPVRGRKSPAVEIVERGSERMIRLEGAGRAAWLHRDLRGSTAPGDSLRWSWRVLAAPDSADLRFAALDDSPIRLYVIFGNPRSLFGGSGRIIFYSVGNREPEGYLGPSHVSDRIHVIRVDGRGERGVWRDHAVDPRADYRRIWGRSPPAITGIGLMQDTDQTGARAIAEVRRIEW